mgnify:CR=1 FL=1
MGTLSNKAILSAMRTGRLVITPEPEFTTTGPTARFESSRPAPKDEPTS